MKETSALLLQQSVNNSVQSELPTDSRADRVGFMGQSSLQ